jgi:hypothetical protein
MLMLQRSMKASIYLKKGDIFDVAMHKNRSAWWSAGQTAFDRVSIRQPASEHRTGWAGASGSSALHGHHLPADGSRPDPD